MRKNYSVMLFLTMAFVMLISLPSRGQSIIDGYEVNPDLANDENAQLMYLAMLSGSYTHSGIMEDNILGLRAVHKPFGDLVTEEVIVDSVEENKMLARFIYHFGDIATLTLTTAEIERIDEFAEDPFIIFSQTELAKGVLIIKSPYKDEFWPDAEIVLFSVPYIDFSKLDGVTFITIPYSEFNEANN